MIPDISKVDGPEPQATLINKLAAALAQDERILACWLHGSFGAGTTDKFSDIDMALAVDDEQFHHAFQSAKETAQETGDCIVCWDSPKDVNGAGFTAFFADCNFLDVKVYRSSRVQFVSRGGPVHALFDRAQVARFSDLSPREETLGPPLHEHVWWKMVFLWICTYSAVRFLKRGDYWYAAGMINSVRGTMAQLFWLWTRPDEATDMSFVVWGVVRRDIAPELASELAATVSEPERAEMVGALGKLIDVFERYGRRIAEDTGAEYPEKLADVVASYYRCECAPDT